MEWSLSKVIRIEAGTVGISANDLRALLNLFHVQDTAKVDNLVTLARAGRERPWQSKYRDVASARLLQFIELEAAAAVTRNFQPLAIPGLLQTEDYARATLAGLTRRLPDKPPVDVDALVEVRMRRQELLSRGDSPELFFIIDEGVTRRLVGGRDVMLAQLRQLTELAARPRITVEVVPFSAGAYPGLNGSFVIQEFPDPADGDVLYQEGPRGEEISSDDPELISQYREIFAELRGFSLGVTGSLSFLDALAKEMR